MLRVCDPATNVCTHTGWPVGNPEAGLITNDLQPGQGMLLILFPPAHSRKDCFWTSLCFTCAIFTILSISNLVSHFRHVTKWFIALSPAQLCRSWYQAIHTYYYTPKEFTFIPMVPSHSFRYPSSLRPYIPMDPSWSKVKWLQEQAPN